MGSEEEGMSFAGDGYVLMDKGRYNPARKTQISLTFKSRAEDALLLLMGDSSQGDFLTIQLKNGKVILMVSMSTMYMEHIVFIKPHSI